MIRLHIPGLYDFDFSGGNTRLGDSQIIDDGKNFEVIDGYCSKGTTHLISYLKTRSIKTPYLHISHAHWDHYDGIRKIIKDNYFKPKALYCYDPAFLSDVSDNVKNEKAVLRSIISEAMTRDIPVIYLKNGDKIVHGEIRINVFLEKPKWTGNSDAYINDGSLCYWFPDLLYFTTGDGPDDIAKMCEREKIKPVLIKIPHHGNACSRTPATWLKNHGCLYCWDNDYSTKITDFLQTGREDCIAVKMKYFSCHGDINMIACNGTMYIYKDNSYYAYKVPYKGKSTLKSADLGIVKAVLKDNLGAGNNRITNLLNKGYYPSGVQRQVNEIIKLVKG